MNTLCGAKTRSGKPCQRPPCVGRNRCHKHGGTNPGGPVKHGRYARFHSYLGDAFQAQHQDPELLRLESDVALLSVRQDELAERLGAGDSPDFRARTLELVEDMERARRDADGNLLLSTLESLGRHVRAGHSRDEAWAELEETTERRVALVKDCLDGYRKEAQIITLQQFRGMLAAMVDCVRSELGEPDAFRVAQRFERDIIRRMGAAGERAALPPAKGE